MMPIVGKRTEGRNWVEGIARDHVRPEFRDSFLHRNPVSRALMNAATRLPVPHIPAKLPFRWVLAKDQAPGRARTAIPRLFGDYPVNWVIARMTPCPP
ncbi:MAG: hypothetical protein IPP91_05140 [Betaproteobacteria bacterium]|nr:hypothetical protein [Betaproteobacteria bacterium]